MPSETTTYRRFVFPAFFLLIWSCVAQAQSDPDLYTGLSARAIGPASVSGRISAIDALNDNPKHIVIGAATGGVWISENGGLTWVPVFDEQSEASIGAVAINQSNPDIIWVGTGEGNTRNSTSIGAGLYKSLDGGKNWKKVGLAQSERINRIALHPDNPNIVYVAALGTLWGENNERGIYKTTDGGESWSRILYVDEKTGATDIKIDPFNPDKLYASMWEHRRWPYFFKSGGAGSGMYISWDGGANWSRKTQHDGLPAGDLGRITFATTPAQQGRVYALVEAEKSALVRSDDGGMNWTAVNEDFDIAVRPFYYTEIAADPVNPDRVYNLHSLLRVSIDGGKTFESVSAVSCCAPGNTVHIDLHAFWINPSDPEHLILGNDGGIAITQDRGDTWRYVRNLPLSQFYHIAVDNDHPYNIYGGLQDNGSWRGPSEIWEWGGIRNFHWQEVGFGDGFDTLPDPENSRSGYVMSQGGFLSRWNLDTGEERFIRPDPPSADTELRFNWNAGIAQDPFDSATIYYGSQFLHKSTDRGQSWSIISADLTTNDPSMQTYHESGGLTPDVTAAENYTSIVAVSPSPIEPGTIWVGTDDGRVNVTRDGGDSWSRIDEKAKDVNPGAWVPMITASPHDAGTAFIVFDDHRRSDMTPYVFRVSDYGKQWENLVSEEVTGYALSVLQDHVDPDLLFIGTEFGLFISGDAGDNWMKFTAGVPTVSVMDMAIQQRENDLILGTHGRSVFVIDDYSALRGLDDTDFEQRLKVLGSTPGQQYVKQEAASTRFSGSGEFRGPNEAYGAMVTFIASGDDLPHPNSEKERIRSSEFQEKNTDAEVSKPPKVSAVVRNSEGEAIRHFTKIVHQGINRLTWNLRHNGVRPLPSPIPLDPDVDLPSGPEVPPGEYRLTLSLHGDEPVGSVLESVTVTVLADPRSQFSADERIANYQSSLKLQELQERAVSEVERIVNAREDVNIAVGLLSRQSKRGENESARILIEQAKQLSMELDELEQRFRVPPETKGYVYDGDKVIATISFAQNYSSTTLGADSPAAKVYTEIAANKLQQTESDVNDFFESNLVEFRKALNASGAGLLER